MGRMKYLQQRANRYEFRFPLPDDLAGKYPREPWPDQLRSLVNRRTGRLKIELGPLTRDKGSKSSRGEGSRQNLRDLHPSGRSPTGLRKGPPETITASEIAALSLEHKIGLLEADEKLRRKGLGLDLSAGKIDPDGLGMSDDDLDLYRFVIGQLDQSVRSQSARMRASERVGLAVNQALEDRGIVLHPSDQAWRDIELAFVRAEQEALESIKARLKGDAIAETIENNVRSKIIKEHLNDPAYYEKLSALLDEIIADRHAKAIEYEEYLKRIADLAARAEAGQPGGGPPTLDTPGKRALYHNLQDDEVLALKIDAAVKSKRPDGWRGVQAREQVVKRALYEILQETDEVERIFVIIKAQREY